MKNQNRIFTIIHLVWVMLSLAGALLRHSIPGVILDLAPYWALVGVLSFIMVMIRHALDKGQAIKTEDKLSREISELKASLYDLEKSQTALEKKLQEANRRAPGGEAANS
jgi:cell shape-determining protein MreC